MDEILPVKRDINQGCFSYTRGGQLNTQLYFAAEVLS